MNIFTGSNSPLGAALTNPTVLSKRKGKIKHDYPVEISGVVYPDAETAYHKLKKHYLQGELSPEGELLTNLDLLAHIIAHKLVQHPRLLGAILEKGGVNWLKTCDHFTNAKTEGFKWWEGSGMESPMIRCLVAGYEMAIAGNNLTALDDRHTPPPEPLQLELG